MTPTTPAIQLSYFDFHGGRGEPIRLAFAIGKVPFEDHRVQRQEWMELKPRTPLGQLPVLEVDGKRLAQSTTIIRYVGRLTGLYPEDPWQAALCDQALTSVEALYAEMTYSFTVKGDAQREAREALVRGAIPRYLGALRDWLVEAGGEWFADGRLTVADLKVAECLRQMTSGRLDHIPADLAGRITPELVQHRQRVLAHPAIAAYYAAVSS